MLALVMRCKDHGTLHAELTRLAGVPALNAASMENLQAKWPPKGLLREAKARKKERPLALIFVGIALYTLLSVICFKFKLRLGQFSAEQYRE